MKTYTLKWASTYNYNLYDGVTLVTDADLATLFGSAGEAYFIFDFNGGTPSNLTRMGILNSSNTVIISKTSLGTGAVKENYRFNGTWTAGATTFTTFAQLQGHTLDEYQLGVISGKIKDAGKPKTGTGAPTTATVADYEGQSYFDSTNDKMYYCTAITPQGTDPETYEYTWEELGGGGSGPTVVQTIGTSTTDVMSQAATSQLIYPSGYETGKNRIFIPSAIGPIQIGGGSFVGNQNYPSLGIGKGANTTGKYSIAIGLDEYVSASGDNSIALGRRAVAAHKGSMALGFDSVTGRVDELSIGKSGSTRYIANVTNPTQAQDAATKNYVDTSITAKVKTNAGAPTTATVGTVGQILEDTTNGKLYICTDATNPYVWTEVGSGGGGTVPTKTSDLTNDGADGTSTYVEADELAAVATSGSYTDLSNTPTVPTITMTTTDPGEGSALAANTFIGVYN